MQELNDHVCKRETRGVVFSTVNPRQARAGGRERRERKLPQDGTKWKQLPVTYQVKFRSMLYLQFIV